jgi:hypothetical protein
MIKYIFFCFLLISLLPVSGISGEPASLRQQDPIRGHQVLYKGKEWHNLYAFIKGDQFLFANTYLQGSVTVNGKTFNDVEISYDIYNDEIITPANQGVIIQLNKEMIDSFSVLFQMKKYNFINLHEDSASGIKGYANSLYYGKTALFVKYRKEIDLLAIDDKYDLFFQTYRVYILKDGKAYQVSGKNDLLKVFQDEKDQIKSFMKKNTLKVTKKSPESFIPVLRYYDSISQ